MEAQYGVFPYEYPIKTAENKCKERYPVFKIISRIPALIFPNKELYTLCYAYFGWFDDIVDSIKQPLTDINFTLQRQKRFLSKLYSDETPEELSTEELFLAHLVNFDKRNRNIIRKDLESLISALEFDDDRRHQLISASEMNRYIENNTVPYINISLAILNAYQVPREGLEELYAIARAGFIIDYVSDMRKDIPIGFINIPQEYIERYWIDLNHLDTPQVQAWVKSIVDPLRDVLSEKGSFAYLPWLAKVFAEVMVWKRREKLMKIIRNDYALPH